MKIFLAAAALVLREQMVRLVPVSGPVLDTCGTGGDDSGTFNISTAAALVACGRRRAFAPRRSHRVPT